MSDLLLSIDQGTTSSRAIVFDTTGARVAVAHREFRQYFPQAGWVEHDPEEIWSTVVSATNEVIEATSAKGSIVGVGIANQRETTVVWDRRTSIPIYNAIVWQDRRTAEICQQLRQAGHEQTVHAKTGLVLDPYFSGTKLAWILDHVEGARRLANAGHLAFGTIDAFLIWRLTNGQVHATDATNASRTLLYNIHRDQWDEELLELLNIPRQCLPLVADSAADFGRTISDAIGAELPISGVAGDQQAAAIGQACLQAGMVKSTYGTGCFVLANTGDQAIVSRNRLLTTIAYRIDGRCTFALEGAIFIAGAGIQWLRDRLGVLTSNAQSEALASNLESNDGVYMVPAFTGLGAPHWAPKARGAIFGLTRDSGPEHLARAALESVAYQTSDLLAAMHADGTPVRRLRVDGGMANNTWFCQFLTDILDVESQRPGMVETTALGAAFLAGLGVGVYQSLDELAHLWQIDRAFTPQMENEERDRLLATWRRYVRFVAEG